MTTTPLDAIKLGGLCALQRVLRISSEQNQTDLRQFVTRHRSALQVVIAGILGLPSFAAPVLLPVLAALVTRKDQADTRCSATHMLVESIGKASIENHQTVIGHALAHVLSVSDAPEMIIRLLVERRDEALFACLANSSQAVYRAISKHVSLQIDSLFRGECQTRADQACLLIALVLVSSAHPLLVKKLCDRWSEAWNTYKTACQPDPHAFFCMVAQDAHIQAERCYESAAWKMSKRWSNSMKLVKNQEGVAGLIHLLQTTPTYTLPMRWPRRSEDCPIWQLLCLSKEQLEQIDVCAGDVLAIHIRARLSSLDIEVEIPFVAHGWMDRAMAYLELSRPVPGIVWTILQAGLHLAHTKALDRLTHSILCGQQPIDTARKKLDTLASLGYDIQTTLWRQLSLCSLIQHPWLTLELLDWDMILAESSYYYTQDNIIRAARKKATRIFVEACVGRDVTTLVLPFFSQADWANL
jgi:hypothetical protein